MKIEKKIWSEYFEEVQSGKKKFELRLADWECHPGDVLLLREWDPKTKDYTGRQLEKTVSSASVFKLDDLFWPKEEIEKYGLMVLSLE